MYDIITRTGNRVTVLRPVSTAGNQFVNEHAPIDAHTYDGCIVVTRTAGDALIDSAASGGLAVGHG